MFLEITWFDDVDSSVSGLYQVLGCCEQGNEHFGSTLGGKYLD
jgi:hypothetical protein